MFSIQILVYLLCSSYEVGMIHSNGLSSKVKQLKCLMIDLKNVTFQILVSLSSTSLRTSSKTRTIGTDIETALHNTANRKNTTETFDGYV